MDKRTLDKEVARLSKLEEQARHDRLAIIARFKRDCPHRERHIEMTTNYHEDEYGYVVPGWTNYTYTCLHCGTQTLAEEKLTTIEEIQDALNKENAQKVNTFSGIVL